FYELFFDFRDRKEERLFVLKILNPRGELISFKLGEQDGQDRGLTLMNIGYKFGASAVLKELGLDTKLEEFRSDDQLMDGARRALLVAAQTKAQLGLLSPGDPGYGLLKVVTAEHAKQEVDQVDLDPLTRLSMDQGAMLVFKQIVTKASEE